MAGRAKVTKITTSMKLIMCNNDDGGGDDKKDHS